jgi:hypothetical protein
LNNEGTLDDLRREVEKLLADLRRDSDTLSG